MRTSEEVRAFQVERRDRVTLHGLILAELEPGTIINTDEWRGYIGLNTVGFYHDTVNHSRYFVDPRTGARTQNIKSAWAPIKIRSFVT